MIAKELQKLASDGVISHWELGIEDREAPGGIVTIHVFRVFLVHWDDHAAKELSDRFRELQSPHCLHPPVIHDGAAHPYITVPLG